MTDDSYWNELSWIVLRGKLADDPAFLANKEVARRVVSNEEPVVNYYLGPLCEGLVRKISQMMGSDAYADFFLFIASPFDEATSRPGWHKVSLYDGRDCSLKSYTSYISCRHFYKQALREKKRKISETELLEFRDYASLLDCEQPDHDGDSEEQLRMKRAFAMLKERDQKVLEYLVIEKMSGIDAYMLLESFVHPQAKDGLTSDEVKAQWTLKQKQDVVSLMKGRALKHLLERYNELNHN